jgi:hypothetical protein
MIPVVAYWVVSLEWLLFPFFFGEHQIIMLATGFIFALVGVFVILLLIVTIKEMS